MAEHNVFGQLAESKAAEFLESKTYRILERNWKYLKLEIDLIAEDMRNGQLAIVEVKARINPLIDPEEAVDLKKKKFLVQAANEYIEQNEIDMESRFDIIAVEKKGEEWQFTHYENAFHPYEI